MPRRNAKIIQLNGWFTMIRPKERDIVVAVVVGGDRASVSKKARILISILELPWMPQLMMTQPGKAALPELITALEMPRDMIVELTREISAGRTVPIIWNAFHEMWSCAENIAMKPPDRGWRMQLDVDE